MSKDALSFEKAEACLTSDPELSLEWASAELERAARAEDPPAEARAAAVAAYAALALGDPDRALGFARRGSAIKGLDSALRARLFCAEGIAHYQVGRYGESIGVFQRALRIARRSGERGAIVRVLGNLGIAYHEASRFEESQGYFKEALVLAKAPGWDGAVHPGTITNLQANLGAVLAGSGKPRAAIEILEAAREEARAQENCSALVVALRGLGEAYRVAGWLDQSVTALEEALALASLHGLTMAGVRTAAHLVRSRIEAGELDEAEILLETWLPCAAAGDRLRYAEFLGLRGRLHSLRGRYKAAYEDAERAGELYRRSGPHSAAEASLERERGSLRRQARRLSARVESWAEAVARALADLIEARDEHTGLHIDRSSEIVRLLGEELRETRSFPRLGDASLATIVRMAPLHDIGKVAVPDAVLLKPGPLDSEELAAMRRHVIIGREILMEASRRIRFDPRVSVAADIAGYHHERWDGAGYPEGLAGDDIPLPARLVALADVYDAIRSTRPYKPALPRDFALDYIAGNAGAHFDPRLVTAFLAQEPRIAELYGD